MLASLLRRLYLFQVVAGALLGAYFAESMAQVALLPITVGAVLLPLLLQFMVIGYTMFKSRAQHDPDLWWQAFLGEFVAALQIFCFQLPWTRRQPEMLMPDADTKWARGDSRLPVLLVHGYICNHRVWDKLARVLRRSGHPVLAINLEPLFTSIDNYAQPIEQAVQTLLRETGTTKVVLIGHSMGGLAIRAWMRSHGSHRVARVITLGTPHMGTQIAKLSPTPNGAQMIWHSPWLKALQCSETSAIRALMHIALTHQDNIVFPQRDQVLEGADITEFKGLGHLEMCQNDGVIQWVLQQFTIEHA